MAKDDITLTVGVNAKPAIKDLKSLDKEGQSAFKKLTASATKSAKDIGQAFGDGAASGAVKGFTSSIFNLKTAIGGLVAGAGLVKFISSVTDAASIQEDAIQGLTFALDNSADSSRDALQGFKDYASELQTATGLGDELSLEIIGLAKSFGASDKAAKDFAAASIELSAVTGKTVEETSRQLIKSLGGLAGELGEISPIFKSLTAEQLKAGGAAKAVLDNFTGAAAGKLQTFTGALTNLSGRFGDFQESLGEIITKNPVVASIINGAAQIFQDLEKEVRANQNKIAEIVGVAILSILETARLLGEGYKIIFGGIGDESKDLVTVIKSNFKTIAEIIGTVLDEILEVKKGYLGLKLTLENPIDVTLADSFEELKKNRPDLKPFLEQIEEIEKKQLDVADAVFKIGGAVAKGAKVGANKAKSTLDKLIDDIKAKLEKGIDVTIDVAANVTAAGGGGGPAGPDGSSFLPGANTAGELSALQGILKQRAADDEAAAKKEAAERQIFIQNLVGGLKDAFVSISEGFVSVLSGGIFNALSDGLNFLADIPKGFAEGAQNLEKLLLELPDVVLKIVEELPKTISKLLDTFTKQFPKFIKAISKAIPAIVKQLGIALPKIIDSVLDALPGLISSLLDGFADIIDQLPAIFEKIFSKAGELLGTVLKKLPRIIRSIFDAIPKIIKSFVDSIPDVVEAIADNIGPIVTALVEGIAGAAGEIVEGLIDSLLLEGGLERIIKALVRAYFNIQVALIQGILRAFVKAGESLASHLTGVEVEFSPDKLQLIFDNFVKSVKEGFGSLVKDISRPFQPMITALNNIVAALRSAGQALQGKSRTGGFLGKLSRDIGENNPLRGRAATGGTIPNGFPGDNFPSASIGLQSGELVVPRNDVSELRSFLAEQRRGTGALANMDETNALLAQIAGQGGQGGTITLNEDGLTDLLLDFSQRNERTVA